MSPGFQTVLVLLIVGGCALYLLRGVVRSLNPKHGCGGSCGCDAKSTPQASRPHFIPASALRKPRRG